MTGTQQTFHNMKYYGILSTKTTLLIIIQIQSFEKVHLSVVGGCYRGRCYSILTNGSKECYYSLELGLKVSILGKGDKNAA